MDSRTARKLQASAKQLNQLKKMEVQAAKERSSPSSVKKGVAAYKTTVRHALHMREGLLLTGSSQRQFPKAAFLIVRSAIEELGLGHLTSDKEILKIIPTDLATVMEKCQRVDELLLTMDLQERVDAVFSVNDAGNSGKRKITYRLLVGYDHVDNCIKQVLGGADEIAAGGEHIADAVTDDLELLGNPDVAGSCTDSALDVISAFVKHMKDKNPGFLAVGCLLHIMNLVLMNAYLATFGDEEMGVNSALRIGFMSNYLQALFPDHWKDFCKAHPQYNNSGYICTGASKGRWWSVIRSFGDVFTNRELYSKWAKDLASYKRGTAYEGCATDLASWLLNKKALTDLAFVRGFCLWFWTDEMTFLQGVGPWQLGTHELFPGLSVPDEKQRAGFRADEHAVRVVIMRAKCEKLAEEAESNIAFQDFRVRFCFILMLIIGDVSKIPIFLTGKSFGKRRRRGTQTPCVPFNRSPQDMRASLSTEEKAQMAEEVNVFRDTALETLAKHHHRWLTVHVDLSMFFPKKAIAVEMVRGLLAVHDGLPLPTVDGAVKQQQVFGQTVDLGELVKVILQFATPELLSETRFFSDDESIADLRLFAAAGGKFEGEWGARLERKAKTFALALPIHSHAAERCVNAGVPLLPKYAPHKCQSAFSGELAAVLDEIRLFQRFAVEENYRFALENGETPKWTTDCRGVTRQVAKPTRNKAIFALCAKQLDRKAERVTPEIEKKAGQRQRQLAASGKSRKALVKQHKKAKLDVGQKKQQATESGGRAKVLTDEAVAAKAAVCNPPKIKHNVIDRIKPAVNTDALALELENRNMKVKRVQKEGPTKGNVTEQKGGMLKRLIEWHDDPLKNSSGGFGKPGGDIPKTTAFDGGKKGAKWAKLGAAAGGDIEMVDMRGNRDNNGAGGL